MNSWRSAFGAALLLLCQAGRAHHSGALFDQTRQVNISGTVSDFIWENPHSSFKVSTTDPDGRVVVWAIEMGGPNNLVREGWKRTTIQDGDKVTVTVRPLRDGGLGGLYVGIVLPDGRALGATAKSGATAP